MRMLGDWKLAEGAYLAAAMKKPRRVIPVCTGLPPNGGPMWQLWTQNRGACAWCYHNTLGPIPQAWNVAFRAIVNCEENILWRSKRTQSLNAICFS